jgi:hypothetical protein
MTNRIRLLRREELPKTGYFDVRFPDGRKSVFLSWDDEPGRRIRPDIMTQEQALEKARTLPRTERKRSTKAGIKGERWPDLNGTNRRRRTPTSLFCVEYVSGVASE